MIIPKENDMFLNMLVNPEFTVSDFQSVGLNSNNTNLLPKDEYKSSEKITKNEFFQDEFGKFDEAKFENFYKIAGYFYNQLSTQDYNKDILDQAVFSEDNIWVEPEKRKIDYSPKLVRAQNENLVTSSLESVGKRGARTKSISEIAQTQKIYDINTGEWKDSPNDSFFDNFFNTLVLATYEEDEFDPETGKKIHQKGEYKLNENGVPYYETLGGRDVYGKQVLNKMNILTTDGSFANKFDFFDSDDINQKSIGGTILKNAALVGTMFIPGGIGATIIGANVAMQSAGLLATIGKLFVGNDSETLNNIQGWAKTVNRSSQTEYASSNTWCGENFLNMIGDTIGQLAEQRWIFKAAPVLLGNTKAYKAMQKGGYDKIKGEKLAQLNKTKESTVKELLNDIKNNPHPEKAGIEDYLTGVKILNEKKASKYVDDLLEEGYKFSAPLSRAYMTALVVQDTYGEAKAAGASDLEAALLTLGYAWAENKILKSDLGNWIMPELKGNKFKTNAIINALSKEVKEANEKYIQDKSKKGLIQNILNIGKKIADGEYAQKALMGSKGLDVIGAHALGESFEEVSEELLADLSKSVFNITRWLRGEDSLQLGQWENIGDRYLMSALGGFIGGGINSAATDFSVANSLSKMNKSQAMQELIYLVNNGKEGEFLAQLDKMTLGNKNLSAVDMISTGENGIIWAEAKKDDNQDLLIKKLLRNQVNYIKNVLEAEGAKISTESLLNKLTLEDQNTILQEFKFNKLRDTQSMGLYLQDYQNLQNDLISEYIELSKLESTTSDSEEENEIIKNKKRQINEELKQTREKIKQYKEGKIVPEAIMVSLFEMNSLINNSFTRTTLPFFAESKSGKKWKDLSDEEKKTYEQEYKEHSETGMKNDINTGAKLFRDMTELYTPYAIQIQDYISNLQSDEFKTVLGLQQYTKNILDYLSSINLNSPGFDEESYISSIQDILDQESLGATEETGIPLLNENIKQQLADIQNKPITEQYTINMKNREYITKLSDSVLDVVDSQVRPFIQLGHINPEVKKSLLTSLDLLMDFAYSMQDPEKIEEVINSMNLNSDQEKFLMRRKIRSKYKDDVLTIQDHIKEIKKLTHTPILQYLDQFRMGISNSDLNLTKHYKETELLFKDTSEDIGMFSLDENWNESNNEALDLINAFISVINGMKTDNAGFNNPTGYTKILNNIFKKQGVKDYVELAELDSQTADLILQDAQIIKDKLEFYKTLSEMNSGQKLKQQDKVGINKNYLLFNSFKRFINIIPDDWIGAEDLKNEFNSLQFLEQYSSENKTILNKEERNNIEYELTKIEDSIYNFFNQNKNCEGGIDPNKLGYLLNKFAGMNGFFQKTDSLLTENSKYIDDNSFIWWIASRAALKSSDFYNVYLNSLNENIAPIASQELATYLGVAAITNMNMLNSFVDAYRNTVIREYNNLSESKRAEVLNNFDNSGNAYSKNLLKYFGGHDVLPQYHNMIFIEGIPGSGKSKGVFTNIINIVKQLDPSLLENALYVHATEKAAKEANSETGLNGIALERSEFLKKWISDQWKDTKDNIKSEKDSSGNVISGRFLYEDSYEINKDGQLINKWKLNQHTEVPKIIFIDEITHYNQQELSMIEQFAKENGIIVLTAGDTDQDTQVVYSKIEDKIFNNTINRNNFIRSPKLGVSLRTLNKQMTESVANMQATMQVIRSGKSSELNFTYLDDDVNNKGLYGVKTYQVDSDKISNDNLEELKKYIQLMIDTSKEPIGYIYSDENSELYKYITSTYGKDKIIPYKDSDAQGLEGQYYIVENKRTFKGSAPTKYEQSSYMRSLYTGISRSEQGVLVIAPSNFGNITSISSKKDKKFQLESLKPEQKKKAYQNRYNQISSLLENFDVEDIKIIPPTKITNSNINSQDKLLPPPLNNFSNNISNNGGFATQQEAQEKLNQFLINIQKLGKIEDLIITNKDSNEQYTIEGTKVEDREENGNIFYYPIIQLSKGLDVALHEFSDYIVSNPNSGQVAQLYNIGDEIIIEENGSKSNIKIIGVNSENDIEYEIQDIDSGNIRKISQTDLQSLYKGPYIPNQQESDVKNQDNPLENFSVKEYEDIITQSNITEEKQSDTNQITHEVYTFNMFEMGVSKDNNGMPQFKGPQSKFAARIDNAIGLMKLPKFSNYNYDQLETIIGQLHNIVNTETNNSNLANQVKSILGLSGDVNISFAIKSSAGRINSNNSKYDIYDIDETVEELSFIKSDDLINAKVPMRKKLVFIVNENGENVFELSTGTINSPLTLIQREDSNGKKIFINEYNTFITSYNKYQNDKDGLYKAIQDVIIAHQNGPNQDLIELFKFWLFTSNGIFYFDDNFNLASNETNGNELIKRKGNYQLDQNLSFTAKFEDLSEIIKDPRLNASSIFLSKDGIVKDQVIIHKGHPFVLISDSNQFKTDKQLVDQFVAQQDPNYKGNDEVKLYYIIPPNGSISDWIVNQHNLYENQAHNLGLDVFDIGNDFTPYRILKSLLESGQFDKIPSSDSTGEHIKKSIKELDEIERKWLNSDINFSNPQQKFEYENLVKNFGEKYARKHMIFQEQKKLLNSKPNWNVVTGPTSANDKTLAKRLSSYITTMVWWKSPGNPSKIIFKQDVLNQIETICKNSSNPIEDVFYKVLYSKNEVGPFVKAVTSQTDKYSLGKTPLGKSAQFRINAKIDTRSFSIPSMSGYIKKFNDVIYNNGIVYKLTQEGFDKYENRYINIQKKTLNVDFRKLIESEYQEYFDKNILNRSILQDESINDKQELLVALAKNYTEQKGNYGFVYNNKLYLIKLDDPNSWVINPQFSFNNLNSITFKINNGNGIQQEREFWFDVDNNGYINQVNCRCTSFKKVNIGLNAQTLELTDEEFKIFKDAFNQVYGNGRIGVPAIVKNSNNSQELIEKIIAEKNLNNIKLKDTLDRINQKFQGKPEFEQAFNILTKMLNYANSVASFNLNIDDIVVIGNRKYKIKSINENQIIGNIVDSNENVTDQTYEFTEDELNQMQKEEPECAPLTLKMI